MNLMNDFKEEKTCIYKNETYSVRDNGAVCRQSRSGKKKRILDAVDAFMILLKLHELRDPARPCPASPLIYCGGNLFRRQLEYQS